MRRILPPSKVRRMMLTVSACRQRNCIASAPSKPAFPMPN